MARFDARFPALPGHPPRLEQPTAAPPSRLVPRVVLAAAVVLALLVGVLLLPRTLLDWDLAGGSTADRARAVNDIRTGLLQAVGGIVVVVGAILTWWQLQVHRTGQVTEAFAGAITQLGDDSVDVRLGGIYALERIARFSPADRQAIEEVLCLFVKNRSAGGTCAIDVNTAMRVLGRRHPAKPARVLALDRVRLAGANLQFARLAKADLHFAELPGAALFGADLTLADLTGTNLRDTVLVAATLYQADLRDAVLTGTMAAEADLRGTDLSRADLSGAALGRARLDHADLRGANLSGADLAGASLRAALADQDTQWPVGFDPAAAGVVWRADAPPIRPRSYREAVSWPQARD